MDNIAINKTSEFYDDHFHFHKISKSHETSLTAEFVQHLILNAFVPVLFRYAKYIGQKDLQLKDLDWLQELKVEKIL